MSDGFGLQEGGGAVGCFGDDLYEMCANHLVIMVGQLHPFAGIVTVVLAGPEYRVSSVGWPFYHFTVLAIEVADSRFVQNETTILN